MDRGYGSKREPHPKDRAGYFSLATFAYIFKLIRKGRKKGIDENDLSNVMKSLKSKKLGDELEEYWEDSKTKHCKPSVIRALLHCNRKTLLCLWLAHLMMNVIETYSIPWALGKFISYFEKDQTTISRHEAFSYAIVMVVINIVDGLWKQHYSLLKTELSLRMQSSVSSLLYRKALTLSQTKLNCVSTGTIITGFTKDVQTINSAIIFGMDNIAQVIQMGLISYLLYQKVGLASVGGIGIVFLSMFCQIGFARITYIKRGACNEKSDQRLKQTQEVLSSIRLIKMYGWETFFEKRLLWLRKIELNNLYMIFILKSLSRTLGLISEKIAHISTLLIYLWLGKALNADIVYYTTKLFHKISRAMIYIPLGIQSLSEFMIALKRINKILHAEENSTFLQQPIQVMKPEITFVKADVQIDELKVLKNLELKLKTGLNILIGPSGCGKSSLLKTILSEYNTTDGKMRIQGTISYATQNPWLFPSSIKQNVLFGEPLNVYKYTKIIAMCGLTHDINTFEMGDEVVLTDCGANLSRGQQARINLARALYRETDIYLLDDCLASLDIHIKNHVFNNAIKQYLSNKLCLLVTHSTQFVNQADNVVIMKEGTVKFSGKPCDIPSELLQEKEEYVTKEGEIKLINENEKEKEDDSPEESTALLSKDQEIKKDSIYKEVKKAGKVDFEVYKSYLKYGGGLIMLTIVCLVHVTCEVSSGMGEKFMSKWLNALKVVSSNVTIWNNDSITDDNFNNVTLGISTVTYPSTLFPSTIFDETTRPPLVQTTMLNSTNQEYEHNIDYFDYFIGATLLATIFSIIGSLVNIHYAMKISRNIHKSMIYNLLQGCMQFFDTHLIGNVLTRFSKDLFLLDEFIPWLWYGFKMIFVLAMSLILIATVNPVFAGLSLLMGALFYCISDYLLSTTRNLHRLSCSTLSPMIGHVSTTLEGLMVIRAHGTQRILRDEFDEHQDLFITAQHLKEISTKVMAFYCHLIASIFTSFITIRLLFLQGVLAGDAGLVITQGTMLSHYLEMTLMVWMITETSMTSVERLMEYTKLAEEKRTGLNLENWPQKGEINFQNVSLTYRSNGETVLRNLNFSVRSQEKIGIVGRTGAGKSSMILTLFKMYDFSGDITIDNVNIKTLSLKCLRTNLAIIPQDPVIFSGTVRANIDPYETISDEKIWNILDVVNMKSNFESLDEDITEKKLSVGQKQLISIARVLTRDTKIVILDEATANMDEEMDITIQKKIKDLFEFCTVITVAHRLNTVMNSDRILVMDNGEMVEFDTPQNLLKNKGGLFYRMVHQKHIAEDICTSNSKNKKFE